MAEAVSWEDAIADLRRFLPATVDFSSVDRLSAAADAVAGMAEWQMIPDWERIPDLKILDRVYGGQTPLAGPLVLVTDHMFASGGFPARVPADGLRDFVGGYAASNGECFFNGDVVILASEAGRLTMFHHEGAFAHWNLASARYRLLTSLFSGRRPPRRVLLRARVISAVRIC